MIKMSSRTVRVKFATDVDDIIMVHSSSIEEGSTYTYPSISEFTQDYFCELDEDKILNALSSSPEEVVVEEVMFSKCTDNLEGPNWDYFGSVLHNKVEYSVYSPVC
jgi:hypothetical protein